VSAIYDRLGVGYARHRQPDPRVAAQIEAAWGDAATIVNVGAGAGSYEPTDRVVVAVEPSNVMLAQRPEGSAPAVRAVAEHLPLPDRSFDAALCVFTLHHWNDAEQGLRELARVVRDRVVFLTWDATAQRSFWLIDEYLRGTEDATAFSDPGDIGSCLHVERVEPLLVPADCTDGFYCAYWARPEAYLDPDVRAAISVFHLLDPAVCNRAVEQLRADLESGAWDERHGHLRGLDALDVGYRVVVATP
jgi:SAM-dependent methyltransferase